MWRRPALIVNRRNPTAASIRALLLLPIWMALTASLYGGWLLLAWLRATAQDVPEVPDLAKWRASLPQSIVITARDGTVLTWRPFEAAGETGFREYLARDRIPETLKHAILAAEDARFYQHGGADMRAILRAAKKNRESGKIVEGASTLTQQIARNLLPQKLGDDKTVTRKMREVFVARRLEAHYTKDELLEAYVNLPFLGDLSYGFAAAARRYFGKSVDDLTPAEAALLAGITRSPSALNPRLDAEAAIIRRNKVLGQMHALGFLSEAGHASAVAQPLHLTQNEGRAALPWAAAQAMAEAQILLGDRYTQGGFSIVATVDVVAQTEAVARVAKWKRGKKPELAFAAIDNKTGYRHVVIGGTDFDSSEFDRLTQACRQPGSAIKPLLYAAAIASGDITAATPLRDAPISEWDEKNEIYWKPANPQATFRGLVIAHDALVSSLNSPAVDVYDRVGHQKLQRTLASFGVHTDLVDVRPSALGASCVKPLELIRAFTAFVSGGALAQSTAVAAITEPAGPLVSHVAAADGFAPPDERMAAFVRGPPRTEEFPLSPDTAFIITNMLRDVVRRGTGRYARFGHAIGGKTGTTNDNTDVWFVGFSARYTAGVWLGYDNPQKTLGARQDGGRYAAPLWKQFMRTLHRDTPKRALPEAPATIEWAHVDPQTGYRLRGGGRKLPFAPGTTPEASEAAIENRGLRGSLGERGRDF